MKYIQLNNSDTILRVTEEEAEELHTLGHYYATREQWKRFIRPKIDKINRKNISDKTKRRRIKKKLGIIIDK